MSYRKGSRKSNSHHYYVPQPPPPPPPVRAYSPSPPQSLRSYERPLSAVSARAYSPPSPAAEPCYEEEAPAAQYPPRDCTPLDLQFYPTEPPRPGDTLSSRDSPLQLDTPRSDRSWAVEPGLGPSVSPQPVSLSDPAPAAPDLFGRTFGYPAVRAPSTVPPASEERFALEQSPILPSAPGMEDLGDAAAPRSFDVQATSVRRLISKDMACFRQFHALRVAVDALSRADRSVVMNVTPEVIVLNLGAGALPTQVVGALTGVELQYQPIFALRPITWDVGLRGNGDDLDNLASIKDDVFKAIQQDAPGAIHLATANGGVADLIVHDLADESLLPVARTILNGRACAIVVVRHGTEQPLPEPVRNLDPTFERTIVIEDSSEPDAWKAELSKLDAILSRLLRSRISATIAGLTSRIDDVRKELKALPAAQVDATCQLMKLVADFSGDIFGIGATRVTQGSFLQQVRDEYGCLSRDVKDTIPHFVRSAPCPPSPPFAPRGRDPSPSTPHFTYRSRPASAAPSIADSRPGSVLGQWGQFELPPERANGLPPPGRFAPMSVEGAPRSSYVTFSSVSMRLQLLRREELPGHFPVDKLCRVMVDECACHWAEIAEQRVQSIAQTIVHRVSARIESVFGPYHDSGLSGKISDIMRERIRDAIRAVKAAISTLVKMEGNFNVQDEEGFLAAKERWDRQYSRDFQQPPGAFRVQNLTRAATLDVMATVSAYLEIAHHRFVDGINRAVDAHVIHALDQDIAPAIMATLKQREAGKWLEPSTEIASERAALQDRLEALVRAREEVMLCALA